MAEQPPEGVDPIFAFLNDDSRFANIEMMSALEGYIFWGYEDDHRTNSSSSSTGSITEAGDEQSDIDDDEFASTGSTDGAGQEPDGIGQGDAADSDGPSQASPIVITSAQWPPSDPMFFFNTHLRDKNLLYGNLEMHKNKGLAHLFTAIETVAIILYHSAGPRSEGDILCECIQMSIHYVTQLFERGNYIASKDFAHCFQLFDWDITTTLDRNSHPLISLPDSVASILVTDIHPVLLLPVNRFDPEDEFSNRFLGLPPELRNIIYNMVFQLPKSGLNLYRKTGPDEPRYFSMMTRSLNERKPLDSWESFRFNSTDFIRSFPTSVLLSLLQVNKQIYLEAVGLFYYKNHFYCYGFADLHSFVKAISSPKPVLGIDRSQFINHLSFNFNFEDRKKAAEVLKVVFEKFYNLKELGVYIDEERWEMFKKKDRTPFYHSPEKYTGIDAFYNLIKMPTLVVLDVQGKCKKLKTLLLNPPRALEVNKRQRVKKGKEGEGQKEGVSEDTDKSKGKGTKGKKKDEDKWVVDKRGPWPPTNEHFELKIHVEGKDPETFKPDGEGGFRKVE
ncbi:hypothetical protein KC331_g7492 [Hortaea werneckii]|nr:hypothetical protein KC331_g7492 [Hortaea werneckii]KAI7701052.1 hypothetical protein KC353_g15534 [Hortaea werneckii]